MKDINNRRTLCEIRLGMARRIFFIFGLGCLGTTTCFGQLVESTWDGRNGENWTDASFWSTPHYPDNGNGGANYRAVVNFPVTLDADVTIDELAIRQNLIGPGSMTVDALDWGRGTIAGDGKLIVLQNAAISGGNLQRAIDNRGEATFLRFGIVDGAPTGVWNNLANSSARFDGGWLRESDATFHNHEGATISVAGDDSSRIEWNFQNAGTINVLENQLELWSRNDGTSSGTTNIAEGAALNHQHFGDGTTFRYVSGSQVHTAGVLSFSGGKVHFEAGSSFTATDTSTLLAINAASIEFDIPVTIHQMEMDHTATIVGGSGDVNVIDNFQWRNGTLTGTGTTSLHGTTEIRNGNLNRVVNNRGAATLINGTLEGTAFGVWNNLTGSTARLEDSSLRNSVATFHNAEGATVTVASPNDSRISWNLQNEGLVNVEVGRLDLDGGGHNLGTIAVAEGAELFVSDFRGALHNEPSGTIRVEGNARFTGQSLRNEGILDVSQSVIVDSTSSLSGRNRAPNPGQEEPSEGYWSARLTEGTWIARNGSSILFEQLMEPAPVGNIFPAYIKSNDGTVILDGPGSSISTIDSLSSNDGVFEVRGGRDISLSGERLPGIPNAFFENRGVLRVGSDTTMSFPVGVQNFTGSGLAGEGTMEGTIRLEGTGLASEGTLTLNPRSDADRLHVVLGDNALLSGRLEVNMPMEVANGANFVVAEGATLGGTGTLDLKQGGIRIDGTLDKPVTVSGPYDLQGTITNATLDGATITGSDNAQLGLVECYNENRVEGTMVVNGKIIVNPAGTLILGSGTNLQGLGDIDLANLSKLDIRPTASATVGTLAIDAGASATVAGSLSADFMTLPGFIKIASGGTADSQAMDVSELGEATIEGILTNKNESTVAGTLNISPDGAATSGGMNVTSNGTINLEGSLVTSIPSNVAGTVSLGKTGNIQGGIDLAGTDDLVAALNGSGVVNGPVTVGSVAIIAPGNSPGTLNVGSTRFLDNSIFELEMRDAAGTVGVDTDLLNVTGSLLNEATRDEPLTVQVVSLNADDTAGSAANFNSQEAGRWVVAQTTETISGFSLGRYQIESTAFANDLGEGSFFLSSEEDALVLNFWPDLPPDYLISQIQAGANDMQFDLNADGSVDSRDLAELVTSANYLHSYVGDANLDGEFGSADLITVFQAAKYETGEPASWSEGDWNGDGTFNTGDLIAAFQGAGYEVGPRSAGNRLAHAVPEPNALWLLLLTLPLLRRVAA